MKIGKLAVVFIATAIMLCGCNNLRVSTNVAGVEKQSSTIDGYKIFYTIDSKNGKVALGDGNKDSNDKLEFVVSDDYKAIGKIDTIFDFPTAAIKITNRTDEVSAHVYYGKLKGLVDQNNRIETFTLAGTHIFDNFNIDDYYDNIVETDNSFVLVFAINDTQEYNVVIHKKNTDDYVYINVTHNNIYMLNSLLEDIIKSHLSDKDFDQLNNQAGGYVDTSTGKPVDMNETQDSEDTSTAEITDNVIESVEQTERIEDYVFEKNKGDNRLKPDTSGNPTRPANYSKADGIYVYDTNNNIYEESWLDAGVDIPLGTYKVNVAKESGLVTVYDKNYNEKLKIDSWLKEEYESNNEKMITLLEGDKVFITAAVVTLERQ